MTVRFVELEGVLQRYAADALPPAGERMSALVGARMLDELTGQPPAAPLKVSADIAGTSRAGEGGVVGVAGIPRAVFPALSAQPYDVELTVAAPRFLTRSLRFTVPANPSFPSTFATPAIVDRDLHRAPVVIEGRVVRMAGGVTTPQAGASVRVTGIWNQAPGATVAVPPSPPDLVAIEPPLQIERATATGTLRPLPLTPVALDARTLLLDVPAGATLLRVSTALSLAAGTLLAVDAGDPDRLEYSEIVSVAAASTPDQPATVTVTPPLARAHRTGAVVQRVTAGAAGASRAVTREGLPGDPVLFLANLGGLATGATVQVAGGGSNELHRVRLFDAVTDAAGYYRLPPLGRVAQLTVRAQSGALGPVTLELRPDYTQASQRLDFVLT